MSLWHNLFKECIITNAAASNKDELLQLIGETAAAAAPLQTIESSRIRDALARRESIGSTGLTDAVAIPHCSFDELEEFVVGVVITAKPINFGALDEKPSQIFVFLIGPTEKRNTHIRLLASISKALREASVRKSLLKADSAEEVLEVFSSHIDYRESAVSGQGKSQVTVYLQDEAYFEAVLEAVSSEADGSVVVLETENANEYLYHMPLFAAFWNDRRSSYSRVLISVIARESVNSVLRRIQTICPDLEHNRGVMVTVQDLAFALGALDF